jgi:N-methylhydantoinase A
MLFSDLRYDLVRTWLIRLADVSFDAIEAVYAELIADGRKALEGSGIRPQRVTISRAADMRYVGQEHPVTVQLPPDVFRRRDPEALKRQFDEEHLRRYGTNAPEERAEIVSLRATVTGALRKPPLERIARGSKQPLASASRGKRKAWFGKSFPTPVFARDGLRAGNTIAGPALIEEHASTTVVLPGDRMQVDPFGNLVIEVRA